MRLELNNAGSWKLVLQGLSAGAALDQAKTAAATLAAIDAADRTRPQSWRLVSEVNGGVVEYCEGAQGWKPRAPARVAEVAEDA